MTQIEADKVTIKIRLATLLAIIGGTISICIVVGSYLDIQNIKYTNHEDRIQVLEGKKQADKNQTRADYNKSIIVKTGK